MSKFLFTRISIAVLAAIVTLTSVSCSGAASSNLNPKPSPTPTTKPVSPKLVVNPKLVEANTRFSFKLFSEILKQDGKKNVFVSPSSVAIALSMTYNGAKGETQQAIAKALEIQGMSLLDINQANANLRTSLESSDPNVQLTIANSLWAKKGVDFKPEFIQHNQTFYAAEVKSLDFADPSAPNQINGWVKKNTQGKISEVVDRIDADQVMFLINAIYFKGKWMNEFDKSQTADQPFTLADGRQKQRPMMSQRGDYRYTENQQFQAVSLPYGKGRTSLYVFLPKPNSNLADFQKTLTAENWQTWMKTFSKREGSIQLPRFKMEYETQLRKSLSALGMGIAFDPSKADFSNLSATSTRIDDVKHKTFVEVNEEGTEAAAVTSIGIRATSAQMEVTPFSMTVDRPFFCAIRDNKTGEILFMGAIVDPT